MSEEFLLTTCSREEILDHILEEIECDLEYLASTRGGSSSCCRSTECSYLERCGGRSDN
jgi:hypothetical protein